MTEEVVHDVIANRKQWANALRSGLFAQAKHTLYDGKGYCCLGVAAYLAGCDLPPLVSGTAWNSDNSKIHTDAYKYVQQWVGLRDEAGAYWESPSSVTSLVRKNDDGNNFNTIADLIESKPDGLFID